eukprot:scaffold317820_cov31-Tisochrysis_lutea.AAC.2
MPVQKGCRSFLPNPQPFVRSIGANRATPYRAQKNSRVGPVRGEQDRRAGAQDFTSTCPHLQLPLQHYT